MSKLKIKLSVLDQSPILGRGKTASDALYETTESAKLADKLGFTRYWLSEHHNGKTLAGTAPEILTAHIASQTKRIRVGSGGIMLPNHSTLKMAENFRLLEALYPNRIDMGIGRAPGTDRLTAAVLNPSNTFSEDSFIQQIYDLGKYFTEADDKGSLFEKVKAYPSVPTIPQRWLLTSSGDSALFAARFGLPMSYAHFINPNLGRQVMDMYKDNFEPSEEFPNPMTNIAVFAFCSENEEKIMQQQALMDHRFVELERGNFGGNPIGYEDIKDVEYSVFERQRIKFNREKTFYDTPDKMKKRLDALARSTGTNEIMLITYTDDLKDRLKSFELIAEQCELS